MENYKKNPFINVSDDPTKGLDLSGVTLEKQYYTLSADDRILIFCKLNGWNHKPADIIRFVSDDYFLGNSTNHGDGVYDYWKKTLQEIYPDPIHNPYPYISMGGAIGQGKSFVGQLMSLYTYHKLDCIIDPYKFFNLVRGKAFVFMYGHVSAEVVTREFILPIKGFISESPYFQNLFNKPKVSFVPSGLRDQASLGANVLYGLLSEQNFYPKPEYAIDKMNTLKRRFLSRFQYRRDVIGHVVSDTSARGDASPQKEFEESVPPSELYISKATHWDVKTKDYEESGGRTFDVYTGDTKNPPYVLAEGASIPDDQDPDKLIKVPIQLHAEFQADIIKSLQDLAGISVADQNSFFNGNISHLVKCCNKVNLIPDTIHVDFYDKSQNLYEQVKPMIEQTPPDKMLFVHLDLGLVTDHTGFSAVYFDHYESSDGKTLEPVFVCPLTVSIDRISGQQTSIFHIYQLLSLLSKSHRICVSADTAFSAQILQDLERDGVETRSLSVDRSDQPYIFFKNVVNREKITIPENQRLLRECYDLKVTPKGKIDHPKIASVVFDNTDGTKIGSKDVADSLAGALWSCHLSLSEGNENGVSTGYLKQGQLLENLTETAQDLYFGEGGVYQDMLEELF